MAADIAAADIPPGDEIAEGLAQPSSLAAFWAAFRENKGAVFGLAVFGLVILLALSANVVAPYSPIDQFRDAVRAPPLWETGGSWRFILGTDGDGHDMLSRLIFGARVSLLIGFSVMSVSFVIGVVLGLLAAMTGPIVDVAVTQLMDLIMAVPSLVLAILVVAVLGPSLANTIVAVTIVYLPRYVRLVRASALGELNKDYVTAARLVGVGPLRLALSTVLPNCLAPLIVMAALGVSDAILEAAGLGFLGLGAQPPTPEWGSMLADSREFIRSDPWIVDIARPRHPHHRRRHQPDRRRLARRARSEDAAELMTPECAHEPFLIALAKTMGPTLALLGAIVAWLANNLISWCGWQIGRSVRCFEAMKALKAEIASNRESELYYANSASVDALVQQLKTDLGPYKPWTPYAPVVERNPVFDNLVGSLAVLPARVSERVVAYYNLTSGLTAQLKDFTSEAYKQLSRARQEAVIRDLYPLGAQIALAADSALATIELYLQRYRLALALFVAAGALTLLIGVPALIGASSRFVQVFISAAEWASTCDMVPKK